MSHYLLPSRLISRKLTWKESSRDLNWHPALGYQCSKWQLSHHNNCSQQLLLMVTGSEKEITDCGHCSPLTTTNEEMCLNIIHLIFCLLHSVVSERVTSSLYRRAEAISVTCCVPGTVSRRWKGRKEIVLVFRPS